ncbi:hypothetical protein E2C01_041708 [Portunus trituberculatus]|uniref:Uncharacterized protein n=1 Tax=Portunus trituberculatus TaxID=210409 RepID=A0A5B7FRF5_PORTR|nr:hypothetical protein [Portunus trituberculatus]
MYLNVPSVKCKCLQDKHSGNIRKENILKQLKKKAKTKILFSVWTVNSVDSLAQLTEDKIVERGNFKTALQDKADLLECGEKMERSVPVATITSRVHHLNVSRETIRKGGLVVKNEEVTGLLMVLVLSM